MSEVRLLGKILYILLVRSGLYEVEYDDLLLGD